MQQALTLADYRQPGHPEVRWFSMTGCVLYYATHSEVHAGGMLLGSWTAAEPGMRNLLLVSLAANEGAHFEQLSRAFGVTSETLRQMRQQAENEGMQALWARKRGGSTSKVTPVLRGRLERWFEEGMTAAEAHRRIVKRYRVSQTTVWRVRTEWRSKRGELESSAESEPAALHPDEPRQYMLPTPEIVLLEPTEPVEPDPGITQSIAGASPPQASSEDMPASDELTILAASAVQSGRSVQHLGAWLLLAVVAHLGLHQAAARQWGLEAGQKALRVALDSIIIALALGERCVEGVRRLATPMSSRLLRAEHAPSATWVRRILHRFADRVGSVQFHLSMASSYLAAMVGSDDGPCIFYVDNHMRPYTGKHKIRRGWRMQDKRARPGVTDYYVHDEDGRPVLRIDVAANGSLTRWLLPIARLLRLSMGADERILLCFDRAGAYPNQMATLRDHGFEFVTYERKPYPCLSPSLFTTTMMCGDEEIRIYENRRKNLGRGHGRVRRIAVLTAEGTQINLLALSSQPAEHLVAIMMADGGRWIQENAFKHGAERWGINQLDGRRVTASDPDAVIPNPARRRADRALRIARAREGEARRRLARLPPDHPQCERWQRELRDASALQAELEGLRAHMPVHAPLRDTELAGTLVEHDSHYKTVIDTIRIACANAESELATVLAPHLPRSKEAKKVLANLFAAPGDLRVTDTSIIVTLRPAGTSSELAALTELFATVARWNLTLPGDRLRRSLRFQTQVS